MKSQKGVTLMSLVIYVIAMLIIVSVVGTIATTVYNDAKANNDYSKNLAEYNNFNMYFLKDIKEENAGIKLVLKDRIQFKNGNVYTFSDGSIYFNKISIADGVQKCEFSSENIDGKTHIIVKIKLSDNFEKERNIYTRRN